jgi:hypothetical protein
MKYIQCQSCQHLKDICSDLMLLKAELKICGDYKFDERYKRSAENTPSQDTLRAGKPTDLSDNRNKD